MKIARPLAAACLMSAAACAHADIIQFEAQLSAAKETPSISSEATGLLTGVLDTEASTFTFQWWVQVLTGVPASPGAHFHRGGADVNGPIAFAITGGAWELEGAGEWTGISGADMNRFMNGTLYANFHTDVYAGGEVRGQLEIVPAPGAATAIGLTGLLAARRRRR